MQALAQESKYTGKRLSMKDSWNENMWIWKQLTRSQLSETVKAVTQKVIKNAGKLRRKERWKANVDKFILNIFFKKIISTWFLPFAQIENTYVMVLTITFETLLDQAKEHLSTKVTEVRGLVWVDKEQVRPNLELFHCGLLCGITRR